MVFSPWSCATIIASSSWLSPLPHGDMVVPIWHTMAHFLSLYLFLIAPSDGQCRTTSQKISRPGLVVFGRISPKFEHLPWLALIVPPTPFHRRRRHFSSLPTSSPISQFRRQRAYFHATMFPSPYTLLGWSNASQTQNSMDIDDSKHPTLPKKKNFIHACLAVLHSPLDNTHILTRNGLSPIRH